MNDDIRFSRRSSLLGAGVLGAAALFGGHSALLATDSLQPPKQSTDVRRTIFAKVWNTPLIDTHEHLGEECDRLGAAGKDDWTTFLSGFYLCSELLVAGMPADVLGRFKAQGLEPMEKWKLLEPYWLAVKNTGYGLATRISLRKLYDVDDLSAATIDKIQSGYEKTRQAGFYRRILCDVCKIESCQVNYLSGPFSESKMPTLLMQDLSIFGMIEGPDVDTHSKPTGIKVSELSDWYKVADWWFQKYGRFAVAVKSQHAYRRDIDYAQVPAEKVAEVFKRKIAGQPISAEEAKSLEDHLFWHAVRKATEYNLPVKLHTGYYGGENYMPLSRLMHNAASACDLCRAALDTRFVFMHLCYPYYEELIAVAKHYSNAIVDMCWGWIINPVAAKDFLKKYLVSAPANKILTFGGDYFFVEQVVGHAMMARQGIALALSELVEEGWMSVSDAVELTDPIMHGNARRIFRLEEKEAALQKAPWL